MKPCSEPSVRNWIEVLMVSCSKFFSFVGMYPLEGFDELWIIVHTAFSLVGLGQRNFPLPADLDVEDRWIMGWHKPRGRICGAFRQNPLYAASPGPSNALLHCSLSS